MKFITKFATILNKQDDVVDFKLRVERAKKSINKELFDESKRVYVDGTDHAFLHVNMLPLAFGLVPEQNIKSVIEFIKSLGMACSIYGTQYLMDGLYNV